MFYCKVVMGLIRQVAFISLYWNINYCVHFLFGNLGVFNYSAFYICDWAFEMALRVIIWGVDLRFEMLGGLRFK